jgi:hypothetical protein
VNDDPLRDPHLPVLIVTGSALDGSSLVLESPGIEKLLGTAGDCHLRVDAGNVDHHHARVIWDDRGVFLSDEGSSTGTYVNGERIGADHPLEDGDRVCLGPPGSRNTVKILVRVPPEVHEAQTISFVPPEDDEPVVIAPAVTSPEADEPILLAAESEDAGFQPPPDEVFVIDEPPPTQPPPPTMADAQTIRRAPEPAPPPLPAPPPPPPPRAEPPPPPPPRVEPAPPPLPKVAAAPPAAYHPPPAASPPLPSISERPRPRPDYAPDLPSIGGDREPGDAIVFDDPEATPEARLKRLGRKKVPAPARAPSGSSSKVVVLGGVLLLLLALVGGGMWFLRGKQAAPAAAGDSKAADEGPPSALRITGLEPEVAMPGNTVVLSGANLPAKGLTVTVSGVPATIDESSAERVRFRVPKLPVVVEGQSVPVAVTAGGATSKPFDLYLGKLPLVTEVAPRSGVPGDRVVVKGRGFDESIRGNSVSFGEDPALVLSANSTELAVVVPAPRSSLNRVDAPVIVKRGASTSGDTIVFNITRPSQGIYALKFFGAAVEGDTSGEHAFVATEVGPLLLLTGRGTFPSVGERAAALAEALNGLVGQDPRFEVRGFAVAVAGRPDPVVTVAALDASGYAQKLDPAMSGTAAAPPVIASYWAALLQDTFVLFGKGERPSRVVELSPRGKVLMDLFSEAERKLGTGKGVPVSLTSPPNWTVAKAFREMALVLPTRGGAVASAAVAGRWQGQMQEAGSPTRPLSLELRLEGSNLVGTMTTNVGGIEMNTPLRDITYANGVLSFTLAGGQAPRKVQGRVNGAQLEGTIQAAGSAPAGRISLRYLE